MTNTSNAHKKTQYLFYVVQIIIIHVITKKTPKEQHRKTRETNIYIYIYKNKKHIKPMKPLTTTISKHETTQQQHIAYKQNIKKQHQLTPTHTYREDKTNKPNNKHKNTGQKHQMHEHEKNNTKQHIRGTPKEHAN